MYVNFEYYRIFYFVAKHGSFTGAAQELGSNQPNVTRAMNRLEDETHAKLFWRTNRGVRLTPEGEGLYRHVKTAVMQLEAAEQELAAAVSLNEGSVSVSASETALHVCLLETLERFRAQHPYIRLHIANHSTPQAVRAVREGEADFAVVTTPLEPEKGLESVPLVGFEEILVGGKSFAALRGRALALAELKNYPLITLGRGTMTYTFYRTLFGRYGLEFAPDTEAATADQLLPLARHGMGLAFMPEPLAREALARGELVRLELKEPIPARQVCLVYDPQHPQSEAARALLGLILAGREKA